MPILPNPISQKKSQPKGTGMSQAKSAKPCAQTTGTPCKKVHSMVSWKSIVDLKKNPNPSGLKLQWTQLLNEVLQVVGDLKAAGDFRLSLSCCQLTLPFGLSVDILKFNFTSLNVAHSSEHQSVSGLGP